MDQKRKLKYLEKEIDNLKKEINTLSISNDLYKGLFENSLDGNLIIDKQGIIIESNETFAKMHGYTIDELNNTSLSDLNTPKSKSLMQERMKMLLTGEPLHFEVEHYHKDGHIVTFDVMSSAVKNNYHYFLSCHRDISKQKKAEKIIIDSENQYKALFENSAHIMLLIEPDTGKIIDANKSACLYYGYSKEIILSLNISDINILNKKELEKALQESKSGKIKHLLFKHKKSDGSISPVEVNTGTVKLKGKTLLFSIIQDIAEQKKAIAALKNSEANIKAIIENSLESIWSIDTNYIINYANDVFINEFEATFGVKPTKGINLLNSLPASLQTIWKERYDRGLNGEQFVFEDKITINNRATIYIEVSVNPILVKDKIIGLSLFGKNITETKNSEIELLNSKERFKQMANILPLLLVELNLRGEITYVNQQSLPMFGYKEEELLGKSSLIAHVPEQRDLITKNIKLKYAGYEFSNREFMMLRKDGSVFPALIFTTVVHKNKKNTGLIAIVIDISNQKKVEKELVIAKEKAEESDRLKSAFLANMSHEIRTPMNGILGFASLLRNPDLSGKQQKEFIDIIEKAGERMLNIINDIINISKIESGIMELNIKESDIIEQLNYLYYFFKPQVEEKGMTLTLNKPSKIKKLIVKTDREKLFAIFTNLIKNATKYSNEGTIEIGFSLKEQVLEFYVKDTGIGIPYNKQEAIFERFIQVDIADKMAKQGAGLGLSISKAYVEMLGGKIWVNSRVEDPIKGIKGGSTFYFNLPYSNEIDNNENNIEYIKPKKIINNKLKILIAEDDPTSKQFISIITKKFSKEDIVVSSGDKAVEAIKNNPDIDLILMDIQMPVMDGYKATQQIREFNKDVIIIAQTAFALEGDREKAIANGCNDYISKPINIVKLKNIISKYF
jgi:PAS domain S-box-containing protein